MSTPTHERVQRLLEPYLRQPLPLDAIGRMLSYLNVFQRWSARTNLTTVTDPETVVQRHFGEGIVLAQVLRQFHSLLDLGSGAGFPGLPIATVYPFAKVTLAESQKKKAAFLKEAVEEMGLSVEVWADRAEKLPADRKFEVVTLRAVDNMPRALQAAHALLLPTGRLAFFVGQREKVNLPPGDWVQAETIAVPNSPGHLVVAQLAP